MREAVGIGSGSVRFRKFKSGFVQNQAIRGMANPSCNTTSGYRVHYVGYEMPLAVGALSRKSLPDCALENLNCHYARRLL